jgi:hypothetical protein
LIRPSAVGPRDEKSATTPREVDGPHGDHPVGVARGDQRGRARARVADGGEHDEALLHGHAAARVVTAVAPSRSCGAYQSDVAERGREQVGAHRLDPLEALDEAVLLERLLDAAVLGLGEDHRDARRGAHVAAGVVAGQQREDHRAVVVLPSRIAGLVGDDVVVVEEVAGRHDVDARERGVVQREPAVLDADHDARAGESAGVQRGMPSDRAARGRRRIRSPARAGRATRSPRAQRRRRGGRGAAGDRLRPARPRGAPRSRRAGRGRRRR